MTTRILFAIFAAVIGRLWAGVPLAQPHRFGPAEIYPDPVRTPGSANPEVTQRSIGDTICSRHWSTKLIRPLAGYTSKLKRKQVRENGDTVHRARAQLIDPKTGKVDTETLLNEEGVSLDLTDPHLFEKYFRMLYLVKDLDAKRIQPLRQEFKFAAVGREFKLIEDGFTTSVVVPYGEAEKHLQDLRKGPTRETLRPLQRFLVNIYPDAVARLFSAGAQEEVVAGIFALSRCFEGLYDDAFGLVMGAEPQPDPRALTV
jgi:hypothetical protein